MRPNCYCSLLLLLLVFLLLTNQLQKHTAAAADLNSDRQALLDFAAALPHSRKLNWIANSSVCTSWAGVTCSRHTTPTRVLALRLPGFGFYGRIPANTLGRLNALDSLSLRSNRLYGPLPSDILSLPSIRHVYLQHNSFSGNIPSSSSLSPQLNFIDLSFNSFTGNIPIQLHNLTRLTALILNNNSLTGSIPELSLPRLKQLNLSNNHLNGSIPHSLQHFPVSSFQGNSQLCGVPLNQCLSTFAPSPSPSPSPSVVTPSPSPYPPPPTSSAQSPSPPATTTLPVPSSPPANFQLHKAKTYKLRTGSIVAIAIGSSALFFLLLLLTKLCCSKKKDTESIAIVKGNYMTFNNGDGFGGGTRFDQKPREQMGSGVQEVEKNKLVFFEGGVSTYNFDLEDLLKASAEVLGKGTYGTTYKAILEDGTTVAVKRLKQVVVGRREFEQQMESLGRVDRHPNVVSLRAYYYSKDEKLLVYGFVPFGSLSAQLHGNRESERSLDWESRIKICLGAAKGIAHIHSVAGGKLTHGNIKSSNILITQDLSGCLSDFGVTPLVGFSATPSRNTGYRAPEVGETRKYSHKSDVYSFGVVLLEMLTGKAPFQSPLNNDEVVDLPRWVQSVVREEWTAEVFDIELIKFQNIEEQMMQMLQVALACVASVPDMRPKMQQVVKMIEEIRQPDFDNRPSSSADFQVQEQF